MRANPEKQFSGNKKSRSVSFATMAATLVASGVAVADDGKSGAGTRVDDALAGAFANPPESAKPQVYWQWINGNVTKEGITADLEAMHRVEINGALVQTIGGGPPGPMREMAPQFFDMMDHATREAERLGMMISMHNSSGWAGCGGPWIKPEESMQFVTSRSIRVHGGFLHEHPAGIGSTITEQRV